MPVLINYPSSVLYRAEKRFISLLAFQTQTPLKKKDVFSYTTLNIYSADGLTLFSAGIIKG